MSANAVVVDRQNVEVVRRGERDVIDVLGIWMAWTTTEADTGHHYCVLDMTVPAGAGVPLHHHAVQETFTMMEGSAEFARLGVSGEEWLPLVTGDIVNVPSWAYHGFRNASGAPARILLTCAAGLEAFFRECGTPVVSGAALPVGPPAAADIHRVAAIAAKHGSYFYHGQPASA
jgi:quercetin dioxygenase-like cupin family protein